MFICFSSRKNRFSGHFRWRNVSYNAEIVSNFFGFFYFKIRNLLQFRSRGRLSNILTIPVSGLKLMIKLKLLFNIIQIDYIHIAMKCCSQIQNDCCTIIKSKWIGLVINLSPNTFEKTENFSQIPIVLINHFPSASFDSSAEKTLQARPIKLAQSDTSTEWGQTIYQAHHNPDPRAGLSISREPKVPSVLVEITRGALSRARSREPPGRVVHVIAASWRVKDSATLAHRRRASRRGPLTLRSVWWTMRMLGVHTQHPHRCSLMAGHLSFSRLWNVKKVISIFKSTD